MGKKALLWELLNQGSVSGDCFIKVAYEEAYVDPAGFNHPALIRIIPLNSAFCFPEYMPHDYTRLLRFKLKYRFWGCFATDVQALTKNGWKFHNEIEADDELLTIDPVTDEVQWSLHQGVSVYDYDGEMVKWSRTTRPGLDALATPNHRWLGEVDGERLAVHGEFVKSDFPGRLVTGGGTPLEFRSSPKWSDELVETVAWYLCDGSDHVNRQDYHSVHLCGKKPHKVAAWRRLSKWWSDEGATWNEGKETKSGQTPFYLGKGVVEALRETGVAPGKFLTPEFLTSLTYAQAQLLRRTLLAGDGNDRNGSMRWTQLDEGRRDGYQMLCAMLGIRTGVSKDGEKVQEYQSRYVDKSGIIEERVPYTGQVWCPTVPTGYFMARRNGSTYWTGNTALEGTRQVFSYTELWTEDGHQEFINDELVDSSENPLGTVPIIHIANTKVTSTPWGLSDIQDITDLNREYNQTATFIEDIINYYACVDCQTEALTAEGWKRYDEIRVGDELLTLNPSTDEIEWQSATDLFVGEYDGPMVKFDNRIDAVVTPNHRWLTDQRFGRAQEFPLSKRRMSQTITRTDDEPALEDLPAHARIIVGGGTPTEFSSIAKWSDELVETVAFYLTEGNDQYTTTGWHAIKLSQKNPRYVPEFRRLARYWQEQGATFTESAKPMKNGTWCYYVGGVAKAALEEAAPNKQLTSEFICSLTYYQAQLLHQRLMDGDGTRDQRESSLGARETWYQQDVGRQDGFQMLCAMLGVRTREHGCFIEEYRRNAIEAETTLRRSTSVRLRNKTVWCPTVPNGVWMARRNGSTYWTGNSPTTVIIGAKMTNLERGPKKVWAITQKDAQIKNLESGQDNIEGALKFLELLKEKMHEIMGVPVTALGQELAISNTSGVALALQLLPLLQKFRQKATQYESGFARLNDLLIRMVVIYMPELLVVDPDRDPPLEEGQLAQLDPQNPLTYRNIVEFASPLPLDKLIALNEITMEMQLGLESKEGALRKLGEPSPAEKLQELLNELHQDLLEQGALDLLRAQLENVIELATGRLPGQDPGQQGEAAAPPGGQQVPSAGGPGVNSAPGVQPSVQPPVLSAEEQDLWKELTTLAGGTKIPQVRNPSSSND